LLSAERFESFYGSALNSLPREAPPAKTADELIKEAGARLKVVCASLGNRKEIEGVLNAYAARCAAATVS
jgi:hypothetical protein